MTLFRPCDRAATVSRKAPRRHQVLGPKRCQGCDRGTTAPVLLFGLPSHYLDATVVTIVRPLPLITSSLIGCLTIMAAGRPFPADGIEPGYPRARHLLTLSISPAGHGALR